MTNDEIIALNFETAGTSVCLYVQIKGMQGQTAIVTMI